MAYPTTATTPATVDPVAPPVPDPKAAPPSIPSAFPQAVDPVPPLDEIEQAAVEEMYAQQKPYADDAYLRYFNTHTPTRYMAAMRELVMAGLPTAPPPVLPPTEVVIADGAAVAVTDMAGAAVPGSPGTAQVAAGALTGVKLSV